MVRTIFTADGASMSSFRVLYDFAGQESGEVSVKAGAIVFSGIVFDWPCSAGHRASGTVSDTGTCVVRNVRARRR